MHEIVSAVVVVVAAISLAQAPQAHATSWVEDESASICNSLSLAADLNDKDWITMEISMLQMSQHVSRAQAVAGIREAAVGYCPEYISVVPSR